MKDNLKQTWKNSTTPASAVSPNGDQEYLRIWDKNFSDFTGKVLEIGAGDGYLAKYILQSNNDIEYSILDIESHFGYISDKIGDHSRRVKFIPSSKYTDIFSTERDLLIATHCLSETPRHYYTDILNKISTKSCYIIDYAGDPNDPLFGQTLEEWYGSRFPDSEADLNLKLDGAYKRGGMPLYIGKENK